MEDNEYTHFVKLVSKMRYAQQRYAKEKRPKLLETSKKLEQLVDDYVKKVMEPKLID